MAVEKAQLPVFSPAIVKAVISGDTLVIIQNEKFGAPERTVTLSSIKAPRLANRNFGDEPFAWASREYLRKLCIGKKVFFRVDFQHQTTGEEYATVFFGIQNLAELIVSQGLAWVKNPSSGALAKVTNPYMVALLHAEGQAKKRELGCWTKVTVEGAIRDLPPSTMGRDSEFDAMGFVSSRKGSPIEAIVEYVRDGSTVHAYLLPDFEYVQLYVAGIQAPSMRKKADAKPVADTSSTSSSTDGSTDLIAMEAKHFTEMRVLNRDVHVVLEGGDKYGNLIGSVHYPNGESTNDLAMELVQNGLAKYVEWSASLMEQDERKMLKSAELEAKKNQMKMWKGFVASNGICGKKFTGKVIEAGSGDWIVVLDETVPMTERRVYLSSIKCPKLGNPRNYEKPEPYAREAREFLRQRLIDRKVTVSMEYARTFTSYENFERVTRVMECGSIFLEDDDTSSTTLCATNNIAENLVSCGYASVIKHRDNDDRSNYYADLLAAEAHAEAEKKGIHSEDGYVGKQITDLTKTSSNDAKLFLPLIQKKKINAIVEHIFSGHRFKLYIPEQSKYIAFSLSGVRCPGLDDPYFGEAIAFMRRMIINRDVEIEVENVDNKATFLGSLWISGTNIALTLLEAGLANVIMVNNMDKIPDGNLFVSTEQSAKKKQLKIWDNLKKGASNGQVASRRTKREMKVKVTDILDGGRFYVQIIGDNKMASLEQKLSSLAISNSPKIDDDFNPMKGDIVLSRFYGDKLWYRVMVVSVSENNKYKVFYMDYGNQEIVSYNDLRPINRSAPFGPGLAKLCKLAYVQVPNLDADYGNEAAYCLNELTLNGKNKFKAIIESTYNYNEEMTGRGTGPVLEVTLIDENRDIESVNAAMLEAGYARLARYGGARSKQVKEVLEPYQEEAKNNRIGMWEYGDVPSDEEDKYRNPVRRAKR